MARINSSDLIGLAVATESGERLGTVRAFDMDVESHAIVSYTVKPSRLVALIGRDDLIVRPTQVVAITKNQMTVRDNVVPIAEKGRKRLVLSEEPLPMLQRSSPEK